MEEIKSLLEKILTAQVLTLSKQIDAEAKANGTQRVGGDYTPEAIRLIDQKKPQVLAKLR